MAAESASLPTGRVTFAFVDVVSSTRTFIEHGEAFVAALRSLHLTVEGHAERHGGAVVATEGDGAFLAFPSADAAVDSLVALQADLERPVADGLWLRVRAGAHTGEAIPIDGNYLSVAVHVAARVSATANAGQVLVTDEVVGDLDSSIREPPVDVGSYSLKDLPEPVRVWRIAGDALPPRATPARPTNVQEPRTTFVGRQQELGTLHDLVSTPGLVTVVGPGGAGKTRLVTELALRDADSIPGGFWLVELATLESPDQVVGAACSAIGLPAGGSRELGLELLRRGRSVLLLDNCEHVLDAVCGLVDDLLDSCRALTVLCTSREALMLADEHTWTIPPLAADGAATELFLDRSGGAARDPLELDEVRRLCADLDGLPLAIELAASQLRSAPLAEILAAVEAGREALARRGGQERQRSLDAVLQWSLGRLKPNVRDGLLVLSMFPGRFSPAMAHAVLEAAPRCNPDAIRQLARSSLVDLDGADYRLLSTIRDAARRRLADDPDLNRQALDALVHWAAAYGVERFQIVTTHDDVPDDTVLALEAALAHGIDAALPGLGKAWNTMSVIGNTRGASVALLALSERALDVEPVDEDAAWVLLGATVILAHHSRPVRRDVAREGRMLASAQESGNPRLLERVHAMIAVEEQRAGHLAAAEAHWRHCLQLAESLPEVRHQLPAALTNLGLTLGSGGDVAAEAEYNTRAAEVSAAMGSWTSLAIARLNLADLAIGAGRPVEARDHAIAALKVAPPVWIYRGDALVVLARAYAALGDRAWALSAGRQGLEQLGALAAIDDATQLGIEHLLAALPELRDAPS